MRRVVLLPGIVDIALKRLLHDCYVVSHSRMQHQSNVTFLLLCDSNCTWKCFVCEPMRKKILPRFTVESRSHNMFVIICCNFCSLPC